jgi:hypothetical protein
MTPYMTRSVVAVSSVLGPSHGAVIHISIHDMDIWKETRVNEHFCLDCGDPIDEDVHGEWPTMHPGCCYHEVVTVEDTREGFCEDCLSWVFPEQDEDGHTVWEIM